MSKACKSKLELIALPVLPGSHVSNDLLSSHWRVGLRLGDLLRAGHELVDQVHGWSGEALVVVLRPQQVVGGGYEAPDLGPDLGRHRCSWH